MGFFLIYRTTNGDAKPTGKCFQINKPSGGISAYFKIHCDRFVVFILTTKILSEKKKAKNRIETVEGFNCWEFQKISQIPPVGENINEKCNIYVRTKFKSTRVNPYLIDWKFLELYIFFFMRGTHTHSD